jgi:pimeloyl-ACP methyl ester carboxylesterase
MAAHLLRLAVPASLLLLGTLSAGSAAASAAAAAGAVSAPTLFVESNGRRIAYRSVGAGDPLILCNRFRGILDTWDPAFLDALARHFRVVTFDYSGIGRSTGTASYEHLSLANDARDLADALGYARVVIGGWSLGGLAAQAFALRFPERTSHAVLIGTGPHGTRRPPEPIFFERALKPQNDLDDVTVLFFEPRSAASREAASRSLARILERTSDLSVPLPPELFMRLLGELQAQPSPDPHGLADALRETTTPILVISGDHDISFPVEDWYELTRELTTVQHVVFSQSGHGPQHQFPEAAAELIAAFVRTAGRPGR